MLPVVELEVTEAGNGDDLVVFLRVAEHLRGDCRMLMYDRRGYGTASSEPVEPVGVDGHVDDLLGLLDGRSAVVVGHSFGGMTAVGAAVRAPELVDAVVVHETPVAWAPGWDDSVVESILADPDP